MGEITKRQFRSLRLVYLLAWGFLPKNLWAPPSTVMGSDINISVSANNGNPITVNDEGVFVTHASSVNCVGSGITCTNDGPGLFGINITGGGSTGGGGTLDYFTGSSFVTVATVSLPSILAQSLNGHTTFFFFRSSGDWSASQRFRSTTTFDGGVWTSSGFFVGGVHYTVYMSTVANAINARLLLTDWIVSRDTGDARQLATELATGTLASTFSVFRSTADDVFRSTMSELADNTNTVNGATNLVSWQSLKDVPAGFADGTDDGAGGSGSGDNFGSAVATRTLQINGQAIQGSSQVIIGDTTGYAAIAVSSISASPQYGYMSFSTGSDKPNYEWFPSSALMRAATFYVVDGSLIAGSTIASQPSVTGGLGVHNYSLRIGSLLTPSAQSGSNNVRVFFGFNESTSRLAFKNGSGEIGLGSVSGEVFLEAVTNTALGIRQNGSQAMYIDTSRRVGIGSAFTAPTERLHVNGSAIIVGSANVQGVITSTIGAVLAATTATYANFPGSVTLGVALELKQWMSTVSAAVGGSGITTDQANSLIISTWNALDATWMEWRTIPFSGMVGISTAGEFGILSTTNSLPQPGSAVGLNYQLVSLFDEGTTSYRGFQYISQPTIETSSNIIVIAYVQPSSAVAGKQVELVLKSTGSLGGQTYSMSFSSSMICTMPAVNGQEAACRWEFPASNWPPGHRLDVLVGRGHDTSATRLAGNELKGQLIGKAIALGIPLKRRGAGVLPP